MCDRVGVIDCNRGGIPRDRGQHRRGELGRLVGDTAAPTSGRHRDVLAGVHYADACNDSGNVHPGAKVIAAEISFPFSVVGRAREELDAVGTRRFVDVEIGNAEICAIPRERRRSREVLERVCAAVGIVGVVGRYSVANIGGVEARASRIKIDTQARIVVDRVLRDRVAGRR